MDSTTIKYFVMDVDGTLTDGRIYIGETGEVMKCFDVKDGYGISRLLKDEKIVPVVITGRKSQIVTNRCKELGIEMIFQGITDKVSCLKSVVDDEDLSKVLFVGDDLNDIDCIKAVKKSGGLTACPHDAVNEVKRASDYISSNCGGRGAIRDIIEWVLKGREE